MGQWGTRRNPLAAGRLTPARVLALNGAAYAVVQLLGWVFLGSAILRGDRATATTALFVNVALPPAFIWATYRSVRTAWLGFPPDDHRDAVVPFVVVGLIATGLWLQVRQLF